MTPENSSTRLEMDADETVDTACGYTKSCKPKWLQRFSNPEALLVILTMLAVVQGFAINGINNSNTVMYERRYQLTSRETSLVSIFLDVMAGLVVIVVGYHGANGHQPRIIATSGVVMSLGLFIMCTAQFTSPPYDPAGFSAHTNDSNTCSLNGDTTDRCDADDGSTQNLKGYLALLIIGQMFNGYTGATLYTLGLTLMERSTTSAQSALYLGIFASGSVLGPALGFLSSGALLEIYVDYPSPPPKGLTSEDPAWVGAWWLGFVIAIILSATISLLLFLFPKELPETASIRAAKVCEAHDNGVLDKVARPGFGLSWRQLPKATWYLLKNPCYMCITFVTALDGAIIIGFATFLPKILVVQFNLKPGWASTLTGIVAVPAAVIGECTGGAIIKKWNFNMKQILKLALTCSAISTCLVPAYLARCPDVTFAGVTSGYLESEGLQNLSSACNEGCECNTAFYDPVCANGVQYFSPCHAGCTEQPIVTADDERVYHNCACPLAMNATNRAVTSGICDVQCKLLYGAFVPFGFLQFVTAFCLGTPMAVATLRVVPPEIRTYGMSLHQFFLRFLGSMPGPLLVGAMLDASCIIWQEECGERGSCWVYNNKELAIRITVLVIILKLFSVTFTIVALLIYKAPKADDSGEIEISVDDAKSADNPAFCKE